MTIMLKQIEAGDLSVSYEDSGGPNDTPVVLLLHGFPYDVRAFDGMLPLLPGCRVIVPYLRGYGPTRFLANETMRSGERQRSSRLK